MDAAKQLIICARYSKVLMVVAMMCAKHTLVRGSGNMPTTPR